VLTGPYGAYTIFAKFSVSVKYYDREITISFVISMSCKCSQMQ